MPCSERQVRRFKTIDRREHVPNILCGIVGACRVRIIGLQIRSIPVGIIIDWFGLFASVVLVENLFDGFGVTFPSLEGVPSTCSPEVTHTCLFV